MTCGNTKTIVRLSAGTVVFGLVFGAFASAQDRMPPIPADKLTPAQKKTVDEYKKARGGEPGGPWAGFARQTVEDWLSLLSTAQPSGQHADAASLSERTLDLAVLRGALLDLLATGEEARVTAAVERYLELAGYSQKPGQARRGHSRPPGPFA